MKSKQAETNGFGYDLSRLYNAYNYNEELVRQMVELFMEEIPKSLGLLQKHLANKDHQGLRFVAHDMKTSIDLIGIDLARQLKAIENMSEERIDFEEVKALANEVVKVCGEVLGELEGSLDTK